MVCRRVIRDLDRTRFSDEPCERRDTGSLFLDQVWDRRTGPLPVGQEGRGTRGTRGNGDTDYSDSEVQERSEERPRKSVDGEDEIDMEFPLGPNPK